ncbi:hypothetical protein CEXT_151391 [Caerostris extrusa]|uniref:Uncharacterized protein n=1 Tax=Caerostris extrusa TaxID=172846 RepID=A0AAV4M7Q9_CAEEX|nr:hypothetical protein CEXT_151391 [Caerostris extrusa]
MEESRVGSRLSEKKISDEIAIVGRGPASSQLTSLAGELCRRCLLAVPEENKHIFPLRLLIELGTTPYSIPPGRQKVTIRDSFSVVDDESCREFVYEMFKL